MGSFRATRLQQRLPFSCKHRYPLHCMSPPSFLRSPTRTNKPALLSLHAVPAHFRFNEYVRHGYRPLMSPIDCFISFFTTVSNETGNVVTHFVPALLFCWLAFDNAWSALPSPYMLVRARPCFAFEYLIYRVCSPCKRTM